MKCPSAFWRKQGYTLIEVMVAMTIIAVTFGANISSYVTASRKVEWSAFSFTAQSLALQGIERARAAKWLPANPVMPVIRTLKAYPPSVNPGHPRAPVIQDVA